MFILTYLPALLLCALFPAVDAQPSTPLVKAKLHSSVNYNLCVGLSDGTYNRDIVLRPCTHESAVWSINKDSGTTFIRHRNVCLNGGYMSYDWGFNIGNGGPTYGQLCQDEALRWGYDMWNDISFPWRWDRLPTGQFQLYGFPLHPCLDVKDGRVYDGAKLQIWECHQKGHPDFKNQQFNIEVLGPEDFLRR